MSLCKKRLGWIYAIVLEMLFKSFVKNCRPNHVYKSLNTTHHLNSFLMDKHNIQQSNKLCHTVFDAFYTTSCLLLLNDSS